MSDEEDNSEHSPVAGSQSLVSIIDTLAFTPSATTTTTTTASPETLVATVSPSVSVPVATLA